MKSISDLEYLSKRIKNYDNGRSQYNIIDPLNLPFYLYKNIFMMNV